MTTGVSDASPPSVADANAVDRRSRSSRTMTSAPAGAGDVDAHAAARIGDRFGAQRDAPAAIHSRSPT